ncbi:hypothetical protein H6F44_04195 [Pseudanabaena sp. FACHB-1277]|jgi:hypothetical protein|uniref:Uncharacterized protein n=1 Tax=Pseudanabaena cinerea FACHB-1277 TaxID=2949581 RepID=A0A926UQS4_9CYAN|nr:hypothetical protein [Pseudanabaena cinerea]MBD2149327.1 hypothetical protein [Pseudanabaena cinerea FACHB-1277]
MEIWEKISRQRVRYIVDSYQLEGEDNADFDDYLEDLLQAYAPPQIELALVQVLSESWQTVPIVRGVNFLERSHQLLKTWENSIINTKVSPLHFHLVTGLDPTPVFGDTKTTALKTPSASPIA